MGNCVASNRIIVQNEKDRQPRGEEEEVIETTTSITSSKLELPARFVDGDIQKRKNMKTVRFRVQEKDGNERDSDDGYSKGGAVRIRVVVTQRELIQILSHKSKCSSAEQLLSAMKLKSRKISQVRTLSDIGATNGGWRPALESIPEDL